MVEQPLSHFCFPFLYNLHYKKVLREVDNLKNPEKPTYHFLQPFWVGWQIVELFFFLPLKTSANQFNFNLLYFNPAPSNLFLLIPLLMIPNDIPIVTPLNLFLDVS